MELELLTRGKHTVPEIDLESALEVALAERTDIEFTVTVVRHESCDISNYVTFSICAASPDDWPKEA